MEVKAIIGIAAVIAILAVIVVLQIRNRNKSGS